MKSPGLKNERGRKRREQQPAGCGPFAAVSGGASRRAAPMKYSGGRRRGRGGRGRRARPRWRLPAGRTGAASRSPLDAPGAARRGAVRRPQPQRAAGLGRAAEFRNLPGRGGRTGRDPAAKRRGGAGGERGGRTRRGQGRGGHGASISPIGLLAVGMSSREEATGLDRRGLQVFLHA